MEKMHMTYQIMDFNYDGNHYKIIVDRRPKYNPFRIYRYEYVETGHGVVQRRRLMEKFADLGSCLYWFVENRIRM